MTFKTWSAKRFVSVVATLFVLGLVVTIWFAASLRSEAETRKTADCGLRLRLERLLDTVPENSERPAVTEFIRWLDAEIERVDCDRSYL